jgi:predicted dehydrogenase
MWVALPTGGDYGPIRTALGGLGRPWFRGAFVSIYLHHPDVAHLTICDSDKEVLDRIGDRYQVKRTARTTDLEAVIESDAHDAVHLVTPIPLHAAQAPAVLESGKHCACTVPAATTLADLQALLKAQQRSGKDYMMMETAVCTREFLYARELVSSGARGRIQFLRGAHYQDMENWPPYWLGLPPMCYATHAVSPLLALTGTRAAAVHCFGSGRMRAELHTQYGNTYPIETAIFQLEGTDVCVEVTRSLFYTALGYTERFNVYGERMTFEWQQIEEEDPVVFRMERAGPGRAPTSQPSA